VFRRLKILAVALGAAGVMAAALPASAKVLAFTADLRGDKAPTVTGSKATGQARILVDTDSQTVDVSMDVTGLMVDNLWTHLRESPLGPIHMHVYGGHDHSASAAAQLLFPVPYGAYYVATDRGFHVELKGAPYAASVKKVNSTASFDEFVQALQAGRIVLNIHTNAHNDGEISGDVVPTV
jgi:hypothetical protein